MNVSRAVVTCYRALHRLYPRTFREQYSDQMVQLFRDQLDDESAIRVCTRAVVDLCATVPASHVEAHMHRQVTPAVILVATAALAGAAFAFVEGLIGILAVIIGSGLAILAWQRQRPAALRRAMHRWWQFLGTGVALLVTVIVTTTITGELSEITWAIAAVAMLTSFGLIAAGCVLAFLRMGRRSSDYAH